MQLKMSLKCLTVKFQITQSKNLKAVLMKLKQILSSEMKAFETMSMIPHVDWPQAPAKTENQ